MASEQEDPTEERADRYLLQVWHKSGIMIFERHMHAKPKSWNLFNNVFLFKEMGNDAVYLLRYKEHHMPELFKIMMDVVIVNNYNSARDPDAMIDRTLGYWHGYILIPYGNQIFFQHIDKSLRNARRKNNSQNPKAILETEVYLSKAMPNFRLSS